MKTHLKNLGYITFVVVLVIFSFAVMLEVWGSWHNEWSGYNYQSRYEISDGYCNIAVVPIVGDITIEPITTEGTEYPATNADDVSDYISRALYDEDIQGIMVRIDSNGGAPVASEVIANSVKNSFLPTAALIREAGTSGGYLVASAADTIIASPMSDVGSIGISMSYVGNWEQNADSGLTYVPLISAPFKDYMHPDKPLTAKERSLLERDLDILHKHFVQMVADNRDMTVEQITALADGSIMPGSLAIENGLIDKLGDEQTAREWFASELNMPVEEVVFCK